MSDNREFSLGYLEKRIEDQGVAFAYKRVILWSIIYYVEKSLLIIFSVLSSADAVEALPKVLTPTKPIFAVLVLLITAFDVWLKPETKYKGYFQANDEYLELLDRVTISTTGSKDQIENALAEFKQINERLRAIV
jgi:hypothetical protein